MKPHDKNGLELKVGDKVTVECEVTHVGDGEHYCNLQLKTVEKMSPSNEQTGHITLNAKQVVKVCLLLLTALLLLPSQAWAQRNLLLSTSTSSRAVDNELLPSTRIYDDARDEAVRKGQALVVFVDCEPPLGQVPPGIVTHRIGFGKWFDMTGEQVRGIVVSIPNGNGGFYRDNRALTPNNSWGQIQTQIGNLRGILSSNTSSGTPSERQVRQLPSPFPAERLFDQLIAETEYEAVGPWPKGIPFPKGIERYNRAQYTQSLSEEVGRGDVVTAMARTTTAPEWQVPGGMLGIRGWGSGLYKILPSPPIVSKAKLPVRNSAGYTQRHLGYVREYADGTIFIDNLYNTDTGNVFEQRIRELLVHPSTGERRWRSYVNFRSPQDRPEGYHGLGSIQCASCHDRAGTGGTYLGPTIAGGDSTFSDPFPALER